MGVETLRAQAAWNSPAKHASFRTTYFSQFQYKRAGEPDDYYKSDGGGANGSVLADTVFDYRQLFVDPNWQQRDDAQFTEGFNPLSLVGEVWDLDGLDELIMSRLGKRFSAALASNAVELGTTLVRYYIDENWNGEYDPWWPSEVKCDTTFQNESLRVVRRTASYPDLPDMQHAPAVIEQGIAGANALLIGRTHKDEYRALVEFRLDDHPTAYEPVDGVRPADCRTFGDIAALFANVNANIICVRLSGERFGMIVTRRYFGEFNGDQIIIDTAAGGAEIAHELGHNAGIADISEPNPPDPWTASY